MLRKAAIEIDGTEMFGGASVFLSKIADQIEREQAEDHEIAEWVRERGGIEEARLVIRGSDNRRVELCSWLGIDTETGWSDAVVEMDSRLMPPGCEWPEVDGKPVEIGERLSGYGSGPDGYEVVGVRPTCGWVLVKAYDNCIIEWDASNCKRPTQDPIGADGLPIREDENVYLVDGDGEPFTVICIEAEGCQTVRVREPIGYVTNYDAQQLTHTKPESPDSWEQLEKDAKLKPFGYVSNVLGWDMRKTHTMNQATHAMTLDIVRRAKALADSDGGYR